MRRSREASPIYTSTLTRREGRRRRRRLTRTGAPVALAAGTLATTLAALLLVLPQ